MITHPLSPKITRLEVHSAITSLDLLLTWAKLSAETRQELTNMVNTLESWLNTNPDFKPE